MKNRKNRAAGADLKIKSLALGTVIFCKEAVPSGGGIGFKKPTVVGLKYPTSPAFRVGWHAPLIKVKKQYVGEIKGLLKYT